MLRSAVITASAIAIAFALAAETAQAQPPGPLAVARADLDGDGKTDEVRLGRTGSVEVLFAGAKRIPPPFAFSVVSGLKTGRIELGRRSNEGRILVVGVDGSGAGEALWLGVRGRKLRLLWRGLVGLIDEDTNTRTRVESISGDLYRYVDNPGITRCDGKQSRLEAQKLIGSRLVAAAAPLDIDDGATVVAATTSPPAGVSADVSATLFHPANASSNIGTSSPDLLGQPISLGDRDPRTAWAEGRKGSGRGEYVSFRASAVHEVAMIRLVAGSARSNRDHAKYNRPRRIGLAFDSGDHFWIELKDAAIGTEQWVRLPRPVQARCVTLVLDSVYPTTNERRNRGATALSEVAILSALDLAGDIEATFVARVVSGGARASSARKQLSRRGARAVAAIEKRLAAGNLNAPQVLSLRRILASLVAAPAQLAAGLGQRIASERDRNEFTVALGKLGDSAIDDIKQLIVNPRASSKGRHAAAATLATINSDAAVSGLFDSIAALSGADKNRLVRAAAARALGESPRVDIEKLLAAATASTGNVSADYYRALGVRARLERSEDSLAASVEALSLALSNAQANANNYANNYELRYRLLAAVASIPTAAATGVASTQLQQLSMATDAKAIALRRVIVASLGANHHPSAAMVLTQAAGDADVGVRNAAIEALAEHSTDIESDEPLAHALNTDAWPAVRRNAAGALAARCGRSGPKAALRAAAQKEKYARVGIVILTATVRCGGSGLGELLTAIAVDDKRPTELRAHSLTLLGQVGGAAMAKTLVALFERFVENAFTDAKSISLAQAAAAGLCRVGEPSVVAPLSTAAQNSAYPEIQSAVARALGCYCEASSGPLLQTLSQSTEVSVSIAARRSIDGCKAKRRR